MSLSTDDLMVDTFRGTSAFATRRYPSPCPYSRNTSGQAHGGISEGGQDPLDGYLAVWIGLESVGPAFGTRMHEHGPKLSCNICGNQAGINRDKGEAGMEHAIRKLLLSYCLLSEAEIG